MYQRRKTILHLIAANLLFLMLFQGMQVWSELNRPVWQEPPLLPAGLRTGMLDLVPGFSGVSTNGITYTVNDLGYRDDAIDPTKQQVIFLGDSTTFGLNLAHEDTYPEVWERLVGANYQAVNTATPGHGTATEYRLLEQTELQPAGVVVGFYAQNAPQGLWDNTTWKLSEHYLLAIQDWTQERQIPLVLVYLPSRKEDIIHSSLARDTIADFAAQENISFVDGWTLYRTYMQTHPSIVAEDFFTVPGHPGILGSILLGQALAEVLP